CAGRARHDRRRRQSVLRAFRARPDHALVQLRSRRRPLRRPGQCPRAESGRVRLARPEQIAWLKQDLEGRSASTPIVVFAHMPLWLIYPDWGWGTDDAAEALSHLKRFGSVTVLNGHIHQIMQKVEGNIAFRTACSTAYPQPAPGTAPGPGPLVVPAEKLRSDRR